MGRCTHSGRLMLRAQSRVSTVAGFDGREHAVLVQTMNQAWQRPTEQIVLSAVEKKHRVLGFTCPGDGSSVGALCRMVAEGFARAGMPTLLVDLTAPVQVGDGQPSWAPGEQGIAQGIVADADGFDRLIVRPTPKTRYRFNNVERFRFSLVEDLNRYKRIVVVLPDVVEAGDEHINPAGPAAACDAVFMLCTRSRVGRSQLVSANQRLQSAGVKINGLIVDDAHCKTLGQEMAVSVLWLLRFAPKLANWIATRIRNIKYLN